MKVLYLENNLDLSKIIKESLNNEGFMVTCVYDGNEALNVVYEENFDIFIFDTNAPRIDGFTLLKELREANVSTPTIFTSSLTSMEDLSNGYSSGADAYLKKPFRTKELILRVNVLLKRVFKYQESSIKIAKNIYFDLKFNELKIQNKKISINPKELILLRLLLKHKNECIDFENIYQSLWSYNETYSDMSLRTYIKNLRKHLGKDKILSIKKIGYKLIL
jgi:DNA-binding response OmpR family regulator